MKGQIDAISKKEKPYLSVIKKVYIYKYIYIEEALQHMLYNNLLVQMGS